MCGRRGWPASVRPLGDSLIDIRDRAVLLVEDGLRITLDQEGEGIVIGIPYGSNPVTCPVRPGGRGCSPRASPAAPRSRFITGHGTALKPGRLSDRAVAEVIQRRVRDAELVAGLFGGHSLRAGFATEGSTHGVPEFRIMQDGRWKSSS